MNRPEKRVTGEQKEEAESRTPTRTKTEMGRRKPRAKGGSRSRETHPHHRPTKLKHDWDAPAGEDPAIRRHPTPVAEKPPRRGAISQRPQQREQAPPTSTDEAQGHHETSETDPDPRSRRDCLLLKAYRFSPKQNLRSFPLLQNRSPPNQNSRSSSPKPSSPNQNLRSFPSSPKPHHALPPPPHRQSKTVDKHHLSAISATGSSVVGSSPLNPASSGPTPDEQHLSTISSPCVDELCHRIQRRWVSSTGSSIVRSHSLMTNSFRLSPFPVSTSTLSVRSYP